MHPNRISRRLFLQTASAGVVATTLPRFASAKEPARQGSIQIGYHHWNCSRQWDDDLDRCLGIARDAGYRGFEALLDRIAIAPEAFAEKCRGYGLECVGVNGGLPEAIDFAHRAGIPTIRALVPKEETKRWVDYAGERNVVIAVHNHIGKGGQGTGEVETRDDLLRYLDERPGLMACPDTGHLLLCGDDPVQTIHDLGERIACLHLKDVSPEAAGRGQKMKGMWYELGTGVLDVDGVMTALDEESFDGWAVVEYGNPVDDFLESAKNMRQVLATLGY